MSRARKAIGHVDADCFYVSAERVRDRCLVAKPVGVLGNQGACVIAKSYEMKAAGVATGMPIWDAIVKCPDGIYIKRDFYWYEALSRRMLELAREFSAKVEYYSIDEFFFEAEASSGETFDDLAARLRDRIWERVGVPVTVGIARSRTLAKLIGDSAKPFGARAVLDPEGEAALLAERPVTEITGVAGRRERRLLPWGIRTCLDFARADRLLIRELLTVSGEILWWELNGEPARPILTARPLHKTLSRGGSLGEATDDPVVLLAWLARNLERLVEELEHHAVRAGRLSVQVCYKDGRVGFGRTNLNAPSDRFELLIEAARPCLHKAWIPRARASRMHIIAESLVPRDQAQLGLFDPPAGRLDSLARVKREVNARHGRFTLRSAATLPLTEIYRDAANSYDICDIRGKQCF